MQKITLKARVDGDVVERLTRIATQETRSMSSLVAKILKEYVEGRSASKTIDSHFAKLTAALDGHLEAPEENVELRELVDCAHAQAVIMGILRMTPWGTPDTGTDGEEGKKC